MGADGNPLAEAAAAAAGMEVGNAVSADVVDEALRRIAALPQAPHVAPGDDLRWIQGCLRAEGGRADRLLWHADRLAGIGGSEMGAILSWATGDFASRGSASRIARQKLLRLPPDGSNDDMARGAVMEPVIRVFHERLLDAEGRSWRRRPDIEEALSGGGANARTPWLRGSVDGVYEIDGQLVLVDFKAPSETSLERQVRSGPDDDYVVQINHYAAVGEDRAVRFDRAELVAFDYRQVGVSDPGRTGAFGVRRFPVALDPGLQLRIRAAAAAFWEGCVLRGEPPEVGRPRLLERAAASDDPVAHAEADVAEARARRAALAKFMAEAAERAYEGERAAIGDWVSRAGRLDGAEFLLGNPSGSADSDGGPPPAPWSARGGFLRVSAKPAFDAERAVARLRELGMDPSAVEALRGDGGWESPADAQRRLVRVFEAAQALCASQPPPKAARSAPPSPEEEAAAAERRSRLMASLAKMTRAGLPRRVPGAWDAEKLRAALVACGESCDEFDGEAPERGRTWQTMDSTTSWRAAAASADAAAGAGAASAAARPTRPSSARWSGSRTFPRTARRARTCSATRSWSPWSTRFRTGASSRSSATRRGGARP